MGYDPATDGGRRSSALYKLNMIDLVSEGAEPLDHKGEGITLAMWVVFQEFIIYVITLFPLNTKY